MTAVDGGRSRRYGRTSLVLLVLAVGLAGTVALLAQDGHQRNHAAAPNVAGRHLVAVRARIASGRPTQLRFADREAIVQLLARKVPRRPFSIFRSYGLGAGLIGPHNTPLTVFGLDGSQAGGPAARLLGRRSLESGVAYTVHGAPGQQTIQVPVVSVARNGYSSDKLATVKLRTVPGLPAKLVRSLFGEAPTDPIIVSLSTFRTIAKKMLGGSWESVVSRYERGDIELTPLIAAVYIDVKDLADVDDVAHTLDAAGYPTSE